MLLPSLKYIKTLFDKGIEKILGSPPPTTKHADLIIF